MAELEEHLSSGIGLTGEYIHVRGAEHNGLIPIAMPSVIFLSSLNSFGRLIAPLFI
jgi:hypothetical protein